MANPVRTPNVEHSREEFQHLYAKEKTKPNFVDPKEQFQFVRNKSDRMGAVARRNSVNSYK